MELEILSESNEDVIASLNKEASELGLDPLPLEPDESKQDKSEEKLENPEEKHVDQIEEKQPAEETKQEDPEDVDKTDHTREGAFKRREGKRREELDGIKNQVSELTELVKKVLTAKSPDAQDEAQDELAAFAEENGIDPSDERLSKLTEIIEKRVLKNRKVEEKPAADPQETVVQPQKPQQTPEELAALEQAHYTEEWNEVFENYIANEFPKATAAQIKQAKEELKKIAYTQEFHKTPLKYVYLEKRDTLKDILFTPKGRTAETGRSGPITQDYTEFDPNADIENPSDAMRASDALRKIAGEDKLVIHRNGEIVS